MRWGRISDVGWVRMGPAPHLATCTRCGKHEPAPELPLGMAAFLAYMRYVLEKHRHCVPAPIAEAHSENA